MTTPKEAPSRHVPRAQLSSDLEERRGWGEGGNGHGETGRPLRGERTTGVNGH